MTDKRIRSKELTAFVGVQLTPELLEKLDTKAVETTLNRSQLIRLALLEYLK